MRRGWIEALVAVALACSASSDGPIAVGEQAVVGACGSVSASVAFGSSGNTGSNPLTQFTKLFVPSEVDFAPGNTFYPVPNGGHVDSTLNFGGSITCSYTVALPSSGGGPASPMKFAYCSDGSVPGDVVGTSSVTLTGSYTPVVEDNNFLATATLGIDMDTGNPCIASTCTNGNTITTSYVAKNTVVGGDACTGLEYCDGAGGHTFGPPLNPDDGNPCTDDSCSDGAAHNVPNGSCSAPSGAGTSYPGNGTVPSDISQGMQFLYGTQPGINTGAMDPKRLSVIRGRVVGRDSQSEIPGGVTVSILNHAEFGATTTRSDGWYDIVVNGGGPYVVQYTASGYMTAQRSVETLWLDWTVVPEVALVAPDSTTDVDLPDNSWQYVRGASKSDVDGTRTATILIPPGTTIASCSGNVGCSGGQWNGGTVIAGGFRVPMHATEFTVGGNGPSAMPGVLPPQSGYTYAVDTGIILNGQPIDTSVTFNQDVLFYVENFTNAPLDTTDDAVPYGSYDKTRGVWQPEAPGKVYCILDLNGPAGEARLGYDCQNELGAGDAGAYGTESPPFTDGERAELASVYPSASSTNHIQVWRVGLPHFSSEDLNWTSGPNPNSPMPPNLKPTVAVAKDDPNCNAMLPGSSIECQNQVLGESIPIVGTPYSLHYRSENQNGYHPTITVPYTDEKAEGWTPDQRPLRIEIEVDVAGQQHIFKVGGPYTNNQSITYAWDRNDAYGRPVQGSVLAHIRVGYVYNGTASGQQNTFGGFGSGVSFAGNRAEREITINRYSTVPVHVFDNKALGFGGWTIDAENVYAPLDATLWKGDGTKRTATAMASILTTLYTDTNSGLADITTTPDGNVFALEQAYGGRYLYRYPGGVPVTSHTPSEDTVPLPPTTASLGHVYTSGQAVAPAADGGLLVGTSCGVLHVDYPAMTARLVAGSTNTLTCRSTDFAADCSTPGCAAGTTLNEVAAIAAAPDGSTLFVESYGGLSEVRRVRNDGSLETIAGNGAHTLADLSSNYGSSVATSVAFGQITGLAVSSDGEVYFAENASYTTPTSGTRRVVYRVSTDGILHLFAGGNSAPTPQCGQPFGDGEAATTAQFNFLARLAVVGGGLYVVDSGMGSVRSIDSDGLIHTIAGNHCSASDYTEGALATASNGGRYLTGVTPAADGQSLLYAAEAIGNPTEGAIVQVHHPADITSGNTVAVPSRDGSVLYQFDSTSGTDTAGQHQKTLSRYRGTALATFAYEPSGTYKGQLHSITDANGNVTTISRSGSQITITAPATLYPPIGLTTTLTLDSAGYLSSIAPPKADEAIQLVHDAHGMLTDLTDAKGQHHHFVYDGNGLLTNDTSPIVSPGTRLSRGLGVPGRPGGGWTVTASTPQSRTQVDVIDDTATDGGAPSADPNAGPPMARRTMTSPAGVVRTDYRYSDDTKMVTYGDAGISTTTQYAADPRYGWGGEYVKSQTITNGDRTVTVTDVRTATTGSSLANETDTISVGPTDDGGVNTYTRVYDGTQLPPTVTYTSPLGRQIKVTLDTSVDRPAKYEVLPGNVPGDAGVPVYAVQMSYDDAGRPSDTSQNTRNAHVDYNATGFVGDTIDPIGTTSFGNFDGNGRPQQITLPGSRNVYTHYDLNGNLDIVRMPKSSGSTDSTYEHGFTATQLDLLGTYTPPAVSGTGPTNYGYDLDGLLSYEQQPSVGVSIARDGAGRVSTVSYPVSGVGTITSQYTYDGNGRLTQLASTGVTLNYAYAYGGSRVSQEEYRLSSPSPLVTHDVNYTYDSLMRVKTRTLDTNTNTTFTYGYDADGALSTLQNGANGAVYTLVRAANGMLSYSTIGSGGFTRGSTCNVGSSCGAGTLCECYDYDAYGALVQYMAWYGSAERYHLVYTRDSAGRISTRSESFNGGSACVTGFAYDPNGTKAFLTQTSRSGSCSGTTNYSYDLDGNSSSWSYDHQDRLQTDGYWSWGYDANGDVQQQSVGTYNITYTYDALGNLRYFYRPDYGGLTYNYAVDGQNRRVFRACSDPGQPALCNSAGSGSVGWLYAGSRVIAQLDQSGNTTAHFAYATKSNVPDLMLHNDGTAWNLYRVVSDGIGSARNILAITGASAGTFVESNYGSTDFGAATSTSNYHPFGFAGGIVDYYTGTLRFGARDYSGWQRRWMTKDPIRFGGGLNFYAYCNDDPVNCIDADGHFPLLLGVGLVLAAGALLETDQPHDPSPLNLAVGAAGAGMMLGPADLGVVRAWLGTTRVGQMLLEFFGLGGAGAAKASGCSASAPNIVFKTAHAARHLVGLGVSSDDVEAAITIDIQDIVSRSSTSNFSGLVNVGGNDIVYRAYTLPDGTINVGTYFLRSP